MSEKRALVLENGKIIETTDYTLVDSNAEVGTIIESYIDPGVTWCKCDGIASFNTNEYPYLTDYMESEPILNPHEPYYSDVYFNLGVEDAGDYDHYYHSGIVVSSSSGRVFAVRFNYLHITYTDDGVSWFSIVLSS